MTERKGVRAGEAYDASDPQQVAEAEALSKQRIEERKFVTAGILKTPQGREWLFRTMKDTGLFDDRVLTDSDYANGFRAGMMEMGLGMLRMLCKADPNLFAQMIKENDIG